MKLKLMIFGDARHGKDTAADMLASHFGLSSMSSSFFAAETIMVPYFNRLGISYPDLATCYADRVNHRQAWFEEIKAYNTPDGAKMGRDLYAKHDIYVGMRNVEEFKALKACRAFDYSIWVDRSKHLPREARTSNTMEPEMADLILDNNGTLAELRVKAVNLYIDLISLEYAVRASHE